MSISRLERSLWLGSRGPFLKPDGTEGGSSSGNNANAGGEQAGSEGKQGDGQGGKGANGGESGFKPITTEAELAAYKADLRKNIAADLRKSIKAELDAERTAAEESARKKKEIDDAAAKGEFETAKQQLEADLTTAKTEATTLKGENDQLKEAMKAGLEAGWKDLPEEVRKLGEKQHADDDVLGRWTFLHDPDTKALVAKLTDKGERKAGNGYSPKSNGTGTPEIKSLIPKQGFLG